MKLKTGFYNNRAIFCTLIGLSCDGWERVHSHGNDVMVAQFVFLLGTHTIFQETLMEMYVNGLERNKSTTIFHSQYSHESYKWR